MSRRLLQWCASWGDLFRDETGKRSLARVLLASTLAITLSLVTADAISQRVQLDTTLAEILGTIVIALATWAAGPRIASYLSEIGSTLAGRVGARVRHSPLAPVSIPAAPPSQLDAADAPLHPTITHEQDELP